VDDLGEFHWDKSTQAAILSAFFYGYILTQLLGGWMAVKFGAKTGLQIGLGLTALGSALTPAGAR